MEEIGPYRVVSELGKGAMGTVYLCHDEAGHEVAVKVMHSQLLDEPESVERFQREAEVGLRIQHDNVVRTLAVGEYHNGQALHYLAMEYVEGQTLESLREDLGEVPEPLCRHIAREVAHGLGAIHAANAVHRDLKPENIIITRDQCVKIMDLGVARLMDKMIALTWVGGFVGSALYAAPEQFRGEEVDHRADWFALGLVLYELVTGLPPKSMDSFAAQMHHRLNERVRPAGEINPQVSPYFEEVLRALLKPDREARLVGFPEEQSDWWRRRQEALQQTRRRPLRRIRIPRETALYGRDVELARLSELFELAVAGSGQVVLLEGEEGIGKTRLVDEFAADLPDVNFLYGSYEPGGAATAIGAFCAAFSAQVGEHGAQDLLQDTPLLVPAFDALLRGDTPPPDALPLGKDALQSAFVAATRSLASDRPTIVLIDDLHFAPDEGRALFAALAFAVPGHRILLIGTARPDLPVNWVAEMERLPHTTRLDVPRLSPRDLARLLEDCLGSKRLAMDLGIRIMAMSDGNPFFIFEIVRTLREERRLTQSIDGTWSRTKPIQDIVIPSSVIDLIGARLAELDEEEREMLDVAACAGFEFDPRHIADALGLGQIPVLRSLSRIEKRYRIVRATGRTFVFDSHQLQHAVYDGLSEQLRESYHAALAEALEAHAGDTPDGQTTVALAHHFFRGGHGARALAYLEPALAHVEGTYDNERAVALLRHALDHAAQADRFHLLMRLSNRLEMMGRKDEVRPVLDEALARADSTGEAALRSLVRRTLGAHLGRTGRVERAHAMLTEALALAREAGDRQLESAAIGGLGAALLDLGRPAEAREQFEQQIALCEEIEDRAGLASATGNLGILRLYSGEIEEARALFERDVELSREAGNRARMAAAAGNLAAVLGRLGDYEGSRKRLEQYRTLSQEIGYRRGEAIANGNLGMIHHYQGHYAEAVERQQHSREQSSEVGDLRSQTIACMNLSEQLTLLGRFAEAREVVDEARRIVDTIGDKRVTGDVLYAEALLCEAEGDPKAGQIYETALALQREVGATNGVPALLLALARTTGNRELLEEAREAARAVNDHSQLLVATVEIGDTTSALQILEEHGQAIDHVSRMKAYHGLWKRTGDSAHRAEAHRLLEYFREHAPDNADLDKNPLFREIAAAAS